MDQRYASAKYKNEISVNEDIHLVEQDEFISEKEQRVIVKFKDKTKKDRFIRKEAKQIKSTDTVSVSDDEYAVILLEENSSAEDFISDTLDSYSKDIEFVQPDYKISMFADDIDPLSEESASAASINMLTGNISLATDIKEPEIESDDSILQNADEVIVAVIDTGIDVNHQAYSERIFVNVNDAQDGEDNDGNGYTDDIYGWDFINDTDQSKILLDSNHGTHVTGLIAGSEIGEGTDTAIKGF